MIATALFAAFVARLVVGDWQITDAIVPVAMIAAFPFFEWVIHRVHPPLAATPHRWP